MSVEMSETALRGIILSELVRHYGEPREALAEVVRGIVERIKGE